VPNLLRCWKQVARRFESRCGIALFLDFDGTLAPIEMHPEDVRLDDSARRTLSRLVRCPRVHVWIVTGRRRDDVRARVRVPGIRYLGLYGWEGSDGPSISKTCIQRLSSVKRLLSGRMSVPGVRLEDKGLTVAIHYRNADREHVRRARNTVQEILAPFDGTLRVIRGKKVWEVAPKELGDKGDAVMSELLAVCGDALPIYIGDDLMDETAFTALRSGITVFVGAARRTRARYRLASVAQVHLLLERLCAELR
jgi:trehalose-phosphatase